MLAQNRLNYPALLQAASGTLFGPLAPKLPGPPLLGFDEVSDITTNCGDYGLGSASASVSLDRLGWAFDCHFEGDPVLPATLLIEGLLQLTGLWGAARGLQGRGRAVRVRDVRLINEVKPQQGTLHYVVSVRRFSAAKGIIVTDGIAKVGEQSCVKVSGMVVAIVSHLASDRNTAAVA